MIISTEIREDYGFMQVKEHDDHIYIEHLVIYDSAYRRKGLGTNIYKMFISHLNPDSFRSKNIYLDVFEYNRGGISFWESLGFKPTGEICDQGYLEYVKVAFEKENNNG